MRVKPALLKQGPSPIICWARTHVSGKPFVRRFNGGLMKAKLPVYGEG